MLFPMKKLFSPAERKILMGAGFPRQTVLNWENGAIPRSGNLRLISLLLKRPIEFKKNRRKSQNRARLNAK